MKTTININRELEVLSLKEKTIYFVKMRYSFMPDLIPIIKIGREVVYLCGHSGCSDLYYDTYENFANNVLEITKFGPGDSFTISFS